MRCPGCGSKDPAVRYVIANLDEPEPHECEDEFHDE